MSGSYSGDVYSGNTYPPTGRSVDDLVPDIQGGAPTHVQAPVGQRVVLPGRRTQPPAGQRVTPPGRRTNPPSRRI